VAHSWFPNKGSWLCQKCGAVTISPLGSDPAATEPCPGSALDQLKARRDHLRQLLRDDAPLVLEDQKHLTAYSPEWAYWQFGYCMALVDVIRVLEGGDERESQPELDSE
jgi:hypothetical protein